MTDSAPQSLYQSAGRIHPRSVRGRYARLRVLAMLLLLGVYYAAPWITVGDLPLVWFDLPHRRFHVLGLTLLPQDLIFLTGMLLIAALTLFFFTTLAGRLWCGYACPQTVWTEAFLWIEHFTEGDRHARIKLAAAPWSARKLLRTGSKHALWLLLALLTGLTFVAYFVPARELFPAALRLELGGWPLFWSVFYGLATWGNAGFLREQVCKYMCPYARFQSAMFDRDTLIIAYDAVRGEPRKGAWRARQTARAKADIARAAALRAATPPARPAEPGDCVDCSLCVQVCPVGIDIRNGLQYECIACAACVDACNEVMDSVKKPRGLIRYTSARQDAGGAFRLLRPRVVAYGAALSIVVAGFMTALLLRTPLQLDVLRDRHSLYRLMPDGSVENLYTIKLVNKDSRAHDFRFDASLPGGAAMGVAPDAVRLGAGESRALVVSVRTIGGQPASQASTLEFRVRAADDADLERTRTASFIAGRGR